MIGLLPMRPGTIGVVPSGPASFGLGALGISVDTTGTCPHTEHHTKCINGKTTSLACTAYRDCKTGRLVGTDCWNDQVCSTPAPPPPTIALPPPQAAGTPSEADVQRAYLAVVGRNASAAEVATVQGMFDTYAQLHAWLMEVCASRGTECRGPDFLASQTPAPPVTNLPTTPGPGTAPPTPIQQCDAPSDVTLSPIDRWVEVDPVQCLWQIVRTATPGNPQVLPNVYGGDASIIIPQSAVPGQTLLSPGAVGLYEPSYQLPAGATGYEISSAAILQAFVDILGRGPTPDELTAAEGQGFANIAELYDYVRGLTVEGTGGFGVVTSDWVPSWVTEHPYLTLTGAALGAWWLFGRRRR